METLKKPGSCFVDAAYLALGVPAQIVQAYVNHHFPEADCDQNGYHPTLVNVACLELYKIGLVQIDPSPVVYKESGPEPLPGHEKVVEHLTKWFGRPGFRCIVTGPKADGQEHANAWNGQCWVDPSNPTEPLNQPTIDIRSVWVTTIPEGQRKSDEDEGAESDADQAE